MTNCFVIIIVCIYRMYKVFVFTFKKDFVQGVV